MELAPANLERVIEPLVVLDAAGVVIAANAAGTRLLATPSAAPAGRPATDFPILSSALECLHRHGCRLADLDTSGPFLLTFSDDAAGATRYLEVHRVTGFEPFAVAFLFSRRREAAPAASTAVNPVAPTPASAERKKHVLVTDDDAMVRTIITAVLRHQGFAVVEAQDGEEALELLRRDPGRFDLVMLDLHMPRLGGIEVLERLREMAPRQKVILLSGSLTETADDTVSGVSYQQKPFKNEELVAMVRRTLAE